MRKLFLAAMAVVSLFAAGCTQIDTGNVGVARTMGKIETEERPAGVYFTPIETVLEFTTKEVSFSINDMKPKSRDNLTMADVDVDIYFKTNPGLVAETLTKYQGDFARHSDLVQGSKSGDLVVGFSRVSREARESIYKAVATFDATDMHTKRAEVSAAIQKILQEELDRSDKGVWQVTSVNVRNLVTDPAIEAAIRQRAETDQSIARAKKEVELAKAEAEKKRVTAEGEAAANRILAESLTSNLIRLREIEAQKAFAGQGTHTVLMGQGQPLVSIGK